MTYEGEEDDSGADLLCVHETELIFTPVNTPPSSSSSRSERQGTYHPSEIASPALVCAMSLTGHTPPRQSASSRGGDVRARRRRGGTERRGREKTTGDAGGHCRCEWASVFCFLFWDLWRAERDVGELMREETEGKWFARWDMVRVTSASYARTYVAPLSPSGASLRSRTGAAVALREIQGIHRGRREEERGSLFRMASTTSQLHFFGCYLTRGG